MGRHGALAIAKAETPHTAIQKKLSSQNGKGDGVTASASPNVMAIENPKSKKPILR